MITVIAPGLLSTVQDHGRPGQAAIGVPPSGAADQPAMRLANRLVGNPEDAAAIEMTLIGATLRFDTATTFAVTGADVELSLDDRDAAMNAPQHVAPGQVLRAGRSIDGARSYVAVRGGIDVQPVLGSRSTDLLTGLGPPPLRAGDRLPLGAALLPAPPVDVAPRPPLPDAPELRVVLGPRADWFSARGIDRLLSSEYRVAAASNRIGVRLDGPPLERVPRGELLSEGVVAGALQVPPDGLPILLLNDHPVTGGYPVIATVLADDLPTAGQLRPGQRVEFRSVRR